MAEHYDETTGVEEAMSPRSSSKNELLPWIASGWSHTASTGERAQSQSDKTKSLFTAIVPIIN